MIRHVVMWKFKDEAAGASKQENMEKTRVMLYDLCPKIPEIRRMEIGLDVSGTDMSMDLLLLTEFDSADDLHTYAVHPDHLQVAVFVSSVIESRVVLDCEI